MADHDAQPPRRLRARLLVGCVAAAIPILTVIVALVITGGSTGTPKPLRLAALQPPAAPNTAKSQPTRDELLPAGSGALVAFVQHPTVMRAGPGRGATIGHVKTTTSFGSVQTFWVVRLSGAWLGVISTLAGNNRVGWVPASAVSLSRDTWTVKVSLSARHVDVWHNGRQLRQFPIAVGAPDSPTPTGRFAVTDLLRTGDPEGPYGCCILALSAVAPHAIANWTGGNRIAIHSTPEADSVGQPVSHGCMRMTLPDGRWMLEHIPLGTPTIISSA